MEEGVSWEVYDPIDAMKTWWDDAVRRFKDEEGPRNYKQRSRKRGLATLNDCSDTDESETAEVEDDVDI